MLVIGLLADALQALGVEGDVRDGALVWVSQRLLIRGQHVEAVLLFYPAHTRKHVKQFLFGQAALLALAARTSQCHILLAAESAHICSQFRPKMRWRSAAGSMMRASTARRM
jgi:hypothetical protein